MEEKGREPEALFGSFTSAVGLALGEMLLLTGKGERFGECLAAIETATLGTLLSSGFQSDGASAPSPRSLTRAALRVVVTWHEDTSGLSGIAEAIAALQDVLEGMGVLHTSVPGE